MRAVTTWLLLWGVFAAHDPVLGQEQSRFPFAGVPFGGGTGGDSISGVVVEVDGSSITVAAFEKKIERYIPVRGGKDRVEVQVIPAQPARRFIATGPLAKGSFLKDGTPGAQYRLSDVKVGDHVQFDWRRINGVDETHYIRIQRRPGGKIPASPGEKPGEVKPYHEVANAIHAFEEHGTAIPYTYHPGGKYPQVAPPPRPVIRK
jgi:hypothetical protein